MTRKYYVEVDMEGRFVGYSNDALDLIGYTREEMEDRNVFDVVEDLDVLLGAIEGGGSVGSEYDISLIHKDGRRIRVRVYPEVQMKGGEFFRVKCAFHEI